jgi:hypothetical protein
MNREPTEPLVVVGRVTGPRRECGPSRIRCVVCRAKRVDWVMAESDIPRRKGAVGGRDRQQPGKRTGLPAADVLHDREGWLLRQELVDCGKAESGRCRKCANGPGHGPYWFRYRWSEGKMHKQYVGKTLPVVAIGDRDETPWAATGGVKRGSHRLSKPPHSRQGKPA